VPGINASSDAQLQSAPFVVDAAGGILSFWHTFAFETSRWDGGRLEYRVNGAGAWLDMGSLITQGNYNNTGNSSSGTALANNPGWFEGTLGIMTEVQVNLNSLAGQSIEVRFRFLGDSSVASTGWHVDDISVFRFEVPTSGIKTSGRTTNPPRTTEFKVPSTGSPQGLSSFIFAHPFSSYL
jgi:hypothetical protein